MSLNVHIMHITNRICIKPCNQIGGDQAACSRVPTGAGVWLKLLQFIGQHLAFKHTHTQTIISAAQNCQCNDISIISHTNDCESVRHSVAAYTVKSISTEQKLALLPTAVLYGSPRDSREVPMRACSPDAGGVHPLQQGLPGEEDNGKPLVSECCS